MATLTGYASQATPEASDQEERVGGVENHQHDEKGQEVVHEADGTIEDHEVAKRAVVICRRRIYSGVTDWAGAAVTLA
jgi:hypothetical protein